MMCPPKAKNIQLASRASPPEQLPRAIERDPHLTRKLPHALSFLKYES